MEKKNIRYLQKRMIGSADGGTKKFQVRAAQLSNTASEIEVHPVVARVFVSDSPSPKFTSWFPLEDDEVESPMTTSSRRKLKFYNLMAALFHTSFAVLVALGIGDFQTKLDLMIPLYKTSLSFSSEQETDSFFVPIYTASGGLYITWITISFFGLSAIFHFGAALLYPKTYLYLIDHKICPFRWLEYTFSASIMYLAIAFPTGILSRETLLSGFGLIATTMFFGLLCEYLARPMKGDQWKNSFAIRMTPHLLGYVPQCFAWFIILLQFLDRPSGAPEPPSFVYALVLTELFLFFSFGFIQYYQQRSPPSKYINGEFAYITMSFLAKGSLGIILFTNVLFLSNFDCIINNEGENC